MYRTLLMETKDSHRQFEIIILLDHTHSLLLTHLSRMEFPLVSIGPVHFLFREHSGSVVEYLTRDRGAAGSSITGVTVLCP